MFEGKAAALSIPNLHLIFMRGFSQRVQQPGAHNSPKLQLHMFLFCKEQWENKALEKTPRTLTRVQEVFFQMWGNFLWSASQEWGIRRAQPGCDRCPPVPGSSGPSLRQTRLDLHPAAVPPTWKVPETHSFTTALSPGMSNCNFSTGKNPGWGYVASALQPYGFYKILVQFDTISSSDASSDFFQSTLCCISAVTFISSKFLPCAVISWITAVKC